MCRAAMPCARARTLYHTDAEVLGALELDAPELEALVLVVAWSGGGGLEEPYHTASVMNAGCATLTPRRRCCPCARTAIFLWPLLWSVLLAMWTPTRCQSYLWKARGACRPAWSALITGEDYHAQNGFNARGARHKPSETFEFPVVSLSGGPGEDMRSRARTPAAVWADPFLSHIWAGNGSTGPCLSGCVGPLGCVFTIFLFTWTRSDARWLNGSARWRCPKERVECPVGSE
jgi:hypothetical protein